MHKVDATGATLDNEYTDGYPGITPPTTIAAKWLNSVQRELIAVLAEDGISPNDSVDDQVITAIKGLFARQAGEISGGLTFNSTSLPPTILSGYYDISGKKVKLTTNQTLAVTNTFTGARQALDSFCHYLVCMNSAGDRKYILYGEGQDGTGTISSITGAETTKTLTVATGTATSSVGKILVIFGNDGFPASTHQITGGNGTTTFSFEGQTGLTGGASGTWRIYNRITTLHGTGTLTNIITESHLHRYSPSLGENGAESIAAFDTSRNGYYLNLSGLTDYRVLGAFFCGDSSVVSNIVFSYKTGRNKNDNMFYISQYSSLVTESIRFTNFRNLNGCDYTFIDNVTWGGFITANTDLAFNSTLNTHRDGATNKAYIEILNTNSNTNQSNAVLMPWALSDVDASRTGSRSLSYYIKKTQILKAFSNVALSAGQGPLNSWSAKFEVI